MSDSESYTVERSSRSVRTSRLLAELKYCEEIAPFLPGMPATIKAEHIHDYDLAVLYKRTQHALDDYRRMRQGLVNLAAIVSKEAHDSDANPTASDQAAQAAGQ